jgi:polyvinyl alcohol dehydrogenase (cytochrome)
MRFLILALFCLSARAADATAEGKALFEKNCTVCHKANPPVARTPLPEALAKLPKEKIVEVLTTGVMQTQGADLTTAQRAAIADFLTAGTVATVDAAKTNTCPAAAPALKTMTGWNGWGADMANTRSQPASAAKLSASDVPKLKLKWAFGFPRANATYGQPTAIAGTLFFGSANGTVYATDMHTGCVYWTFKASDTVRSAISLGKTKNNHVAAYFGDTKANMYAVDAQNGELLWKVQVDPHPVARVTGAPKLYEGKLYVPVSSIEEVPAGNPKYACCKFRGSVVALDAETGKQVWKTYAIPEEPTLQGKNSAGADQFGPAGAAIWSSPTIDAKRKVLYVGTGNQYSDPPSKYTDAVLAMDLETGTVKWFQQMTQKDGWNFSCVNPSNPVSCPKEAGPDVDIGSSPILKAVKGKDYLLIGQKSGIVHALDPEKEGAILWQTRIGKGGAQGGIMWGSAAQDDVMFVPLSDFGLTPRPKESTEMPEGGGLFALRIASGEKAWYAAPEKPPCLGKAACSPSQEAPATVIPGVVFSGSMDGHLRAYSTVDGTKLWDYDSLQSYETVNGVTAKGGSMNATGPTIVDGMLFVNSGYGALGGMAGNVLLAFSVDGK